MAVISRQPFQFGLRGMLLLVTLLACGFGLGISFAILVVVIYVVSGMVSRGEMKRALGIVAVMVILTLAGVGVFVQIRLDTGDQRFVVWGIPVFVHRMLPEQREALLSIRNPREPIRWSWCATRDASNHVRPASRMVLMYKDAATWVEADPAVARLIVRDLAEHIESTHGMHGFPECSVMLEPEPMTWELPERRVSQDWRKIPEVQDYLKKKGVPPVTASAR